MHYKIYWLINVQWIHWGWYQCNYTVLPFSIDSKGGGCDPYQRMVSMDVVACVEFLRIMVRNRLASTPILTKCSNMTIDNVMGMLTFCVQIFFQLVWELPTGGTPGFLLSLVMPNIYMEITFAMAALKANNMAEIRGRNLHILARLGNYTNTAGQCELNIMLNPVHKERRK